MSKYEKIYKVLLTRIKNGKYGQSGKLPGCRKLAAEFGVSYLTAVNAVKLLTAASAVTPVQGSGIFVNSQEAVLGDGDSFDIGLISDLQGDLFCNFFRSVSDCAFEKKQRIIPLLSPEQLAEKGDIEYLRNCLKYRKLIIDGVRHFPFAWLEEVNPSGKNIIFVMHCEAPPGKFPEAVRIVPDYVKCGELAGRYLQNLGAERPLLLSYESLPDEVLRINGNLNRSYEDDLKKGMEQFFGQAVEIIRMQQHMICDAVRLKAFENEKCGFFAVGDSRAHALYRYMQTMNRRIERQWQLVGLYNTSWCEIMSPALSSIAINEIEIGRLAMQSIADGDMAKNIKVEPELIERN